MGWFDKFKTEKILIQQEDEHNKFWSAVMDAKTFKVTIRWGRLGTKGQNQEKEFKSEWEAGRFIESKMSEKRRKGYQPIEKTKFDKLCIQSAIVGTSNKCHEFEWVEIIDEKSLTYKKITEERLADPNCNPGIYVEIETKKKYGGRDSFRLLFTFSQMFDLHNIGPVLITKENQLYTLTEKVEEALGRSMSS